jgi:hypothetical protein
LWSRRQPLAGSIGETYLRVARGYVGLLPPTLAFLAPSTPQHHPALIGAFALPRYGDDPGLLLEPLDVQAVHLTLLAAGGSAKAAVEPNKIAVGGHQGLPIAISPPNDLQGLAIHEGVEDALSGYLATNLGCWASGGANFMPPLADAVPRHIEVVTIWRDANAAGWRDAGLLKARLEARGIEARVVGGGDVD